MLGASGPARAAGPKAALPHAAGPGVEQRVLAIAPEFH